MAAVSQVKSTGSGARMRPMLERSSSMPTARISTETHSPARYSYRPWP